MKSYTVTKTILNFHEIVNFLHVKWEIAFFSFGLGNAIRPPSLPPSWERRHLKYKIPQS